MKIVVFGLTSSSSWGNGHATLWRGLCNALINRGHSVVFFEHDVPYYAGIHRDFTELTGGELVLYPDWPVEYGGQGRGAYEFSVLGVVYEANDWNRVPPGTTNMGARMAMEFGSDALKAEALPRFARGEALSC